MTDIVYNKNGIPFDIDAIATDLNGKMDKDGLNATASVCVESYANGSSWYRVYSDGWCEQAGRYTNASAGTVTYLKPFANENYTLKGECLSNVDGAAYTNEFPHTPTVTGFSYSQSSTRLYSWQASGYIS